MDSSTVASFRGTNTEIAKTTRMDAPPARLSLKGPLAYGTWGHLVVRMCGEAMKNFG
jgi:hypothetical protein